MASISFPRKLNTLNDVDLSAESDKDLLVYNTSNGQWSNSKTVSSVSASSGFSGSLYGTASYAINAETLDGYYSSDFAKLTENNTYYGSNIFVDITASNASILNNVIVYGTASIASLNTINQTSLLIGDKYITILSGASDHASLNQSGILWGSGSISDPTQGPEGENAYIKYRSDNDQLEIFPGLRISGSLTASNGFSGNGSELTNLTASNITNFGADVKNIFNAGTNISIAGTGNGPYTISATGVTAVVNGYSVVKKTSNYALTESVDYVVAFSGSNLTGTLPSAVSVVTGSTFIIKNLHTSSLYITASAGRIDNSTTGVMVYSQYTSYTFISDGTDWLVI